MYLVYTCLHFVPLVTLLFRGLLIDETEGALVAHRGRAPIWCPLNACCAE